MTAELQVVESQSMEARPSSGLALSFSEMTMRVAQLDRFYREVMQDGTDYGKIPGTDKPTLYQPGAQMLDQIFGLVATFEILPSSVVEWNRPIPFFHYVILCRLVSRRSGETAAEGIGSANSHEDRYRWRKGRQTCPECGKETIGRSKSEYGGGFFCNAKNGGCGRSFKGNTEGARQLASQDVGRVENDDTASLENTLSKMAQKRAHVAATLNATGASRIFTQDIEDLPQFQQATVVDAVAAVIRPDPEPEFHRGPVIDLPASMEPDVPPARTPMAVSPNKPEPTPKESARARAVVPQDNRLPTRAGLIGTLATNIRRLREAGVDITMPKGDAIQAMTDEELRTQIQSTANGLTAATKSE